LATLVLTITGERGTTTSPAEEATSMKEQEASPVSEAIEEDLEDGGEAESK
jgi:hypothetical protein